MKMKNYKNWTLIVGLLLGAVFGATALHTPPAKADSSSVQTLEASLLTSMLRELIQIDEDIKALQPVQGPNP